MDPNMSRADRLNEDGFGRRQERIDDIESYCDVLRMAHEKLARWGIPEMRDVTNGLADLVSDAEAQLQRAKDGD